MGIAEIFFSIIFLVVVVLSMRLYGRIFANIRLGASWEVQGTAGQRWRQMVLMALGQRKMFKRFIPAFLHLSIYLAFVITQIELVEILIDGIFGTHRFFAPYLGAFYTFVVSTIELLSVLALIATLIFIWRRNVRKVNRFQQPEMKGWPSRDANLILLGEIVLIIGIFLMNGADTILQTHDPMSYPNTGSFLISGQLGPWFFNNWDPNVLVFVERLGWWLHVLTVFAFLLYLPISKHLHILFAFPNTYYGRIEPKGKMENMPAIMNEVKSMLGLTEPAEAPPADEIPTFGARDVFDLSWKNLLEAYTCTECGRCTSVCPANMTGKKLSPRKIMMDVRDRVSEVGNKLASGKIEYIDDQQKKENVKLKPTNFNDGANLFDRISREEIHACTTCNACVEACPILINPLDIILKMRRYEILTEGAGPGDWLPMFNSLENSGAVWQMNKERDAWIEEG